MLANNLIPFAKQLILVLILSCFLLLGCEYLLYPSQIQNFSLTGIDGSTAKIAKTNERRVLVFHLWATWCSSCVEELPNFLNFAESLPRDKYKTYLIAVRDKKSDVKKFKEKMQIPDNIYLDGLGRTFIIFGTTGVPFTAFVDNNLKLIHVPDPYNFEAPDARQVNRIHGPRDWLNPGWLNLFFQQIEGRFAQ